MEVLLLDAAPIDGDCTSKRRAQTVDNPALDLLHDARRIDHLSAIHGADDLVDANLSFVDRYFSHLRVEAPEIVHHCDTVDVSVR